MNNDTERIFSFNSNANERIEIPGTTQVNLEDVDDFSKVCRICATVTEFVIPIFSGEGQQNNLATKIHDHLPIKVTEQDVLPRVVCCQCANTLMAWHELVQCCVQANVALHTRAAMLEPHAQQKDAKPANIQPGTSEENKYKWNTCSVVERNDMVKSELDNRVINHVAEANGSLNDISDDDDDDDVPLSVTATKKSNDLYNNFYKALINFKNHFVTEHTGQENYPDFTESSDYEIVEEDDCTEENANNFDDLTLCNMRKDKMDEETRQELSQVLCKMNGKLYYTCKICNKKLSSPHTYVFHKRIHTGERPCICHICGKQFRAPSGLQRHLTETHERVRRHTCRICSKNFANSQNLKQHMRIHTGERPFVCAHCGKRFTQSGALHVHLKLHTELFPYHCAECGTKFRLRSGLARHRLKHTGERPHVCEYCGKGFRQRNELNNHSLIHTDSKPYACGLCEAAFRQRRALRHHIKRLHENDLTPREITMTHPIVYNNVGTY